MISDIKEIINLFSKGEMIILIDDEERENEGDLVISSKYLTSDHINFMITYGKGLVCAPISSNIAKKSSPINFVEENILISPIDYYYTNAIARSSKVMSECRKISKSFLFTGIEKAS